MVTVEQIKDRVRRLVMAAAEPAAIGETVQAQRRRAADRLGLADTTVYGLWYSKRRQIPAELYEHIRLRVGEMEARRGALRGLHEQNARARADLVGDLRGVAAGRGLDPADLGGGAAVGGVERGD
jgi:hypothetical protein